MKISASITELPDYHPHLFWNSIIAATVAILRPRSVENVVVIKLSVENVAAFDDDELSLVLDVSDVSMNDVMRVTRTHETGRLVEMAAIAIGALAVYHIGRHEIYRSAARGSRADYLLDRGRFLLEVSGRSRKADFEAAWKEREDRLAKWARRGWYLIVVEFENLVGRVTFGEGRG